MTQLLLVCLWNFRLIENKTHKPRTILRNPKTQSCCIISKVWFDCIIKIIFWRETQILTRFQQWSYQSFVTWVPDKWFAVSTELIPFCGESFLNTSITPPSSPAKLTLNSNFEKYPSFTISVSVGPSFWNLVNRGSINAYAYFKTIGHLTYMVLANDIWRDLSFRWVLW